MLCNAYACSVSCAKFLVEIFVFGQRKHAACRIESVASDYNRAVVKRRALIEYIAYQLL